MKRFSIFILTFIFLISSASDAFACACCSEAGTHNISTSKPGSYELGILEEIRFDRAAELFTTVADDGTFRGLENLQTDDQYLVGAPDFFSVANVFAARTLKLNFKTVTGKTGTLALPIPAQMLRFEVDIHDGSDRGLGPLLYKEWRFKGAVQSGNGFFSPGIVRPTSYFLVLQGRGRGCDDAQTFTHWRLEIRGKRADYTFMGKLSSGAKEENETEKK